MSLQDDSRETNPNQLATRGPRCPQNSLDSINERPNTSGSIGFARDVFENSTVRPGSSRTFKQAKSNLGSISMWDPIAHRPSLGEVFGSEGDVNTATRGVETSKSSGRLSRGHIGGIPAGRPAMASFPVLNISRQNSFTLEQREDQTQSSRGACESTNSQPEWHTGRPLSRQGSFLEAPQDGSDESVTRGFTNASIESSLGCSVPPRRELPFKKATAKSSAAATVTARPKTSQPANSARDLPPLPTPTWAKEDQQKALSRRANANFKAPKADSRVPCRPQTSPGACSSTDSTTLEVGVPVPRRTIELRSSSSILDDAGENSTASLEEIQRVANLSHDQPSSTPLSSSQTAERDTSGPGCAIGDTHFARAVGQLNGARPKVPGCLSTRQADTERLDAVNDYIVSLIEDDDFIQLCEDALTCWRRIGLERT